jgi:hypothetical protein
MKLKILDGKYVLSKTADKEKLSVTLKKTNKGYSLFASKNIRKGKIIAYYKFKVYRSDRSHTPVNKGMYAIILYTKSGRFSNTFIGDISEECLEPPKRNIPFWAYFSNEPSFNQESNCFLDPNIKGNYKDRKKIKEGDYMIYRLIASSDIKQGEEICWCYGDQYERNYKTPCSQIS